MIGVGSPVVDLLAQVSEEFVADIHGEKGGMELVSAEVMQEISARLKGTTVRAAGGSAGNTTFAMAKLGARCSFLGKLGHDESGDYYRCSFSELSGDCSRFKFSDDTQTAQCISLITPDSERTMRTYLGAALELSDNEISSDDFSGIYIAHIEGYLLFNPDLAQKAISCAKEAGCLVSIDLGSFEVVQAAESMLCSLLENYVDIVFANEDESRAFCGSADPLVGLEKLGEYCDIAVVKIGAEGAWVKQKGEEPVRVEPVAVESVIDTTGAGDFFAAGFLYGLLRELPVDVCGQVGSLMGARVVEQIGADLPDTIWDTVLEYTRGL